MMAWLFICSITWVFYCIYSFCQITNVTTTTTLAIEYQLGTLRGQYHGGHLQSQFDVTGPMSDSYIYYIYLVGGLEHGFYDFPYIGDVIIPSDELIFFRGVGIPPTRYT